MEEGKEEGGKTMNENSRYYILEMLAKTTKKKPKLAA